MVHVQSWVHCQEQAFEETGRGWKSSSVVEHVPIMLKVINSIHAFKTNHIKGQMREAGEITQWLRALAVPEDTGLARSTHMAAHNHL